MDRAFVLRVRRSWMWAFKHRTGLMCMLGPVRYVIDRKGYGVEFCE